MTTRGDRDSRPRYRTRHDAGMEAQAHHGLAQVKNMKQAQAEPARLPRPDTCAPQGLELRHLRYLVAVAEAGTFTRAAERLFIAQPTLSQQIGRLEQILGTRLLHRRRDGVALTAAGTVLADAARDVLSRVDHGISQTRQAAGLGRPRLRVVMPPNMPAALTVR